MKMLFNPAGYPAVRLRRARAAAWRRELFAETNLRPSDLVQPLFVIEGAARREQVSSLPGVERMSVDLAVAAARDAYAAGVPAVALFPAVDAALKDREGCEALNSDNLVCRTVRAIKAAVPDVGVICDVALDPYTDHGHDGVVRNGQIHNDDTVDILRRQALVLAEAGCDVVAPSDMMDGRVGEIRATLEASGFTDTLILSYAVKYASALYGPFRDAIGSQKRLGAQGPSDKKTYQMDIRNRREAAREAALDVAEGADALMVKPAGTSLDIIADLRRTTELPVFAYQVSGEYAMLMAAAERGMIDGDAALLESLTVIKRAGASAIFTYAATNIARSLNAKPGVARA